MIHTESWAHCSVASLIEKHRQCLVDIHVDKANWLKLGTIKRSALVDDHHHQQWSTTQSKVRTVLDHWEHPCWISNKKQTEHAFVDITVQITCWKRDVLPREAYTSKYWSRASLLRGECTQGFQSTIQFATFSSSIRPGRSQRAGMNQNTTSLFSRLNSFCYCTAHDSDQVIITLVSSCPPQGRMKRLLHSLSPQQLLREINESSANSHVKLFSSNSYGLVAHCWTLQTSINVHLQLSQRGPIRNEVSCQSFV